MDHIDLDTLELYALHHLSNSAEAAVEIHLLVCPECRHNLRVTDDLIAAVRELPEPVATHATRKPQLH